MNRICIMPLVFLLVSCSSPTTPDSTITSIPDTQAPPTSTRSPQATQVPTPTGTPDIEPTSTTTSFSLEVTFDGNQCKVHEADEINPGEHVLVLHNDSGQRSVLIAGRLYPDKSWEDFLQWFQDNCGPPGSSCEGPEAPWISWLFPVKQTDEGPDTRYFQYDLNMEAEYILVTSRTADSRVWPCGAFRVVAAQ